MQAMNKLKVALVGFAMSLSLAVNADQIFVERATGSGVTESELNSATILVRASVTENSSNELLEESGNADFVLKPSLMRLGESVILSISKVKKSKTVFSSQLKAARMDELDKVASRLTRAVLKDESGADSARVGEMTDQEAKEGNQRRPARDRKFVSLGAATLNQMNAPSVGYSLGLGYSWDLNTVALKLFLDGAAANSAFLINTGVGINYYFMNTHYAPYVSGDFGLGWAKADGGSLISGDSAFGFMFGFGGGIELFRTSTVNLDIGLRVGLLMKDNGMGLPTSYSLRVGLYF